MPSLPIGERYPPLNLTRQKQKEKTLRALCPGGRAGGAAAGADASKDAQCSDPTSLELLDLIIDRVPALPLLVIITFRAQAILDGRQPRDLTADKLLAHSRLLLA